MIYSVNLRSYPFSMSAPGVEYKSVPPPSLYTRSFHVMSSYSYSILHTYPRDPCLFSVSYSNLSSGPLDHRTHGSYLSVSPRSVHSLSSTRPHSQTKFHSRLVRILNFPSWSLFLLQLLFPLPPYYLISGTPLPSTTPRSLVFSLLLVK